ncbi:MAG: QacE family quaternary ammonium compound efflux SMR transporter [Clostridia bacterium]|nr:QacE family quaternary ammonium compound efflux SMR transporter [Clostridia bacterium]
MGYLFLGLAMLACVAGSSALTASDGMVIKKHSVLGVLLFAFSYVLLSRSILTINISIAYAVFCGVGIVLSGLISVLVFRQKITLIGVFCMALILAACVIIHLYGSM